MIFSAAMKPETLSLLCAPRTHEALELVSDPQDPGRQVLRGVDSGSVFLLREGIPVFLEPDEVTGLNRKYQRMYDRIAPIYDLPFRIMERFRSDWEEERRRPYLEALEIREGDALLEVSVGTGANLSYLPRSLRRYGLDISWGMLKRCRRRIEKSGLDTELFQGSAEALPFRDRSFDVVFHVGGINFFDDRERAIREMVRVAKPGTKIVIVDETEKIAKGFYERIPLMGKCYRDRPEEISAPVELVPDGMLDLSVRELREGDLYCLEFRTPS
jgi:ubiquinone/menaquinone biosynthesis C-methylase UbiE